MKIILTSNNSWSLYNFRYGLMKALKEKGFEASFCANRDAYTEKLEKEFPYHEVKMERKGKNPFKDLKLIFDLYRVYKREKPDICYNFSIKPCIYATLAQSMAGVKNIYPAITGLGYAFQKEGVLRKIVVVLYKFSLKRAKKVIFQNKEDRDLFVKLNILKKEKTEVVRGSGVDTEYFKKEKALEREKITITFVGRMLYQKGIGEFVKAAKKLKEKYGNLTFLLVGPVDMENPSGIKKEKLSSWHKEGFVNYLGERSDIREVLAGTDIFVFPSYYREGVPRALLEAGAMGLPLVTTDHTGCREAVEEGKNGFLTEPKNAEDLTEKIEVLVKDENLRKKMGERSREKMVEEFDEREVIEKYINVIHPL